MNISETRGWFDCLNAVAIELQADFSFDIRSHLINVMNDANITLEEVRWAQEQDYGTLNECEVLFAYEGMLMEREEMEE